jgi:uncharacterized repeat protein (TIGR03803 family)
LETERLDELDRARPPDIAAANETTSLDRSGQITRLAEGERLGPYEIVKPLKSDGMGETYCARDTRLGRKVALKVLPARPMERPRIRNWLETEAQVVARLNHPNIGKLHDIGRDGDIDFLVMEYLEGQSLAHRLKEGPLLLADLLRIAIDIARALDYAHRKGVIHGGLKPSNIILNARRTQLVDFGLSRWRHEAGEFTSVLPWDAASSLTVTSVVVGAPGYMAPEQIQGREVGVPADIFALGAVIFETASRRKAFAGETTTDVVRAILSGCPPDLSNLVPTIPAALDRAVRRCLNKSPAERWQSAGELVWELKRILENSRSGEVTFWSAKLRFWGSIGIALGMVLCSAGDRAHSAANRVQFRRDLRPEILYSLPALPAEDASLESWRIGWDSQAGVINASKGSLYGTSLSGGPAGFGMVLELTPPAIPGGVWIETTLYGFTGGRDGTGPAGSVVEGDDGALYGVTRAGGAWDHGTVFRLAKPAVSRTNWTEEVLHSFLGQNGDGSDPGGTLILGKGGTLFGVTQNGGTPGAGFGTVFELSPPSKHGRAWTEKVLHKFTGLDGNYFPRADLLIGNDGALYGTTHGCTIFKLTPPARPDGNWIETVLLHVDGEDETSPIAGLVAGRNGVLYGTTLLYGGSLGSLFQLMPPTTPGGAWQENVLHRFTGKSDGSGADSGVLVAKNGELYSVTLIGGAWGKGTIFKLTPPKTPGGAWTETVLYSFSGRNGDGAYPKSMPHLIFGPDGALYGTTLRGGISNGGTVFRLRL